MKFSNKTLLIVGNGVWAHKVKSSISNYAQSLDIKIFPARDFLLRSTNEITERVCNQFVWIASRPQLQLEVLGRTHEIDFRAIIEKPIAVNLIQLNEFQNLFPNLKADLYLSEPWKYSANWSQINSIIRNQTFPVKIKVIRGGPSIRSYVNPVLDWIYHDLGLLGEILFEFKEILQVRLFSLDEKNIVFNLKVPEKFDIDLSIGYFKNRIALWEIDDVYHFRFDQQQTEFYSPLFKMYKNVIEKETRNILENQIWLIKKVSALIFLNYRI